MDDWLQFWVTNKHEINRLWTSPELYSKNKIEKVSKSTGELYSKETREFEGITFKKEPHYPKEPNESKERIVIGFKPHYWYNGDKHNANDFNAIQCIKTMQKFIDLFEIKESNFYPVNNIEYGLNFLFNNYGKEFIGYNIYHSRNEFIQDQEHKYAKRAHSYTKGKPNYYLYAKLYSKGFQFPEYCNSNTLRFELGSRERKYIKKLGIETIEDLLNIKTYYKLKNALINNANNILILEQHPILLNLNKRDKNRLITKYTNSASWFDSLQNTRSAAFNEKKARYFELLDRTGYNINYEFQKSIREKLDILLPEKRKDSTPLTKPHKRKDSTLDKGRILTVSNNKIYPVTGVDISMQKKGSKLS